MPAIYAHLRFGREAVLPEQYAALPRNFPQLFRVGLQGPDPFFFYNPLMPTATGSLGNGLHRLSGREFFTQTVECCRKAPSDGAKAYLFGLLGHYCLDSHCHPLVFQATQSGTPSHTELEAEFDRFLQQLDGRLPQDRGVSQYLKLTPGEKATAAAFYPGVSPRRFGRGLTNMARVFGLVYSRHRKTAKLVLRVGGDKALGLIPSVGPNRRCAHFDQSLMDCYQSALADYTLMARELAEFLENGTPLGELFDPTFEQ